MSGRVSRLLDIFYAVFLFLHVLAALLIDTQNFLPVSWYPEFLLKASSRLSVLKESSTSDRANWHRLMPTFCAIQVWKN